LKAVVGVTQIETDLDEQSCTFCVAQSVDIEKLLYELAEKNNKIAEWKLSN